MATGDHYLQERTTITFTRTSGDVTWSPDGLGLFGRVSPPGVLTSLGDSVGPGLYRWGFKMKLNGTEKIGREVRLYLGYSDGTNNFNISQTDASINPETLTLGSHYLGNCVCNANVGIPTFTAFGWVMIPVPQVQVIMWNDSGLGTVSTINTTAFYLTPLVYKKVA